MLELLFWCCAVAAAVPSIIQARHMLRAREISGLSLTTEMCWIPSWALWATYAVVIGAGPMVLTTAVGALASIVITAALIVQLRRARRLSSSMSLTAASLAVAGTAASLLAWKLIGIEAMAVSIAAFDAVSLGPALLASVRSNCLKGVSLGCWSTRIVLSLGGIAYALHIGHPAAGGWHYVALPASIFLVCRILRSRRSALTPAPTVVVPAQRVEVGLVVPTHTPAGDLAAELEAVLAAELEAELETITAPASER